MEWINVKDSHFVDLEIKNTDYSTEYSWTELSTCPQEPFLVGVNTNKGFEWAKVVLTDFGLEEVTDDDTQPWGWSIIDVQYWFKIIPPNA
tara:strand:- start:476 stop:745 length:270 start_codon:yes stop_codon:yes gene_type:complete